MPTFGTTPRLFGGYSESREDVRTLMPDERWLVRAQGFVDPKDANTATIELVYEKNDGTIVVLGSVTQAGVGRVKKRIQWADVFGTVGVPSAEDVPMIRLRASKNAGINGELDGWMGWLWKLRALR